MPFFKGKPGVVVIEMQGIIGTTIKEPEYSGLLESVQNNRKIGALVPDIDSPVGSATATYCTKTAAALPSASPSSPPCAACHLLPIGENSSQTHRKPAQHEKVSQGKAALKKLLNPRNQ